MDDKQNPYLREFMQRKLEAKAARAANGKWLGFRDATIRRVELEESYDDGWSEYTPGVGWEMWVKCYDTTEAGGNIVYVEHYTDSTEFIYALCRFAYEAREVLGG